MRTCMLCKHFSMSRGYPGYSEMTPGADDEWRCDADAMPGYYDRVPPVPGIETEDTLFSIALEFNPGKTLINVAEQCKRYHCEETGEGPSAAAITDAEASGEPRESGPQAPADELLASINSGLSAKEAHGALAQILEVLRLSRRKPDERTTLDQAIHSRSEDASRGPLGPRKHGS